MRMPGLGASTAKSKWDFGVTADRKQVVSGFSTSRRLLESAFDAAGIRIDGSEPWDIKVKDERFYRRVLHNGSLGLGESYVEGWWDCEQIDRMIHKIMEADLERIIERDWRVVLYALEAAKGWILNLQSQTRAAEAAKVHYDLDFELFQHMLGPTMVYSCAYWKDAANLDRAQEDKLNLVCRKLDLCNSDKILDVGCGWGGLLKYSVERYGCNATGITISARQSTFAKGFCQRLPVQVLRSDYRDFCQTNEGQFDKIACIGMFEHVGKKNYLTFMRSMDTLLHENGLFLLQTVGRCRRAGTTDPWLEKYMFPNGMLPSAAEIARATDGLFVIEDWHNFGPDYDRTLMAWHANFEAYAARRSPAFNESFHRMWKYYLLSCAGSFRARRGPQLWQIVMSKGRARGYRSIR